MDTSPSDKVAQPKHTPGPWHITHEGGHTLIRTAGDSHYHPERKTIHSRTIATVHGDFDLSQSNAALIAAAPMMLEACKLAIRLIDPIYDAADHDPDMDRAFEALHTAIAAAEGRSK